MRAATFRGADVVLVGTGEKRTGQMRNRYFSWRRWIFGGVLGRGRKNGGQFESGASHYSKDGDVGLFEEFFGLLEIVATVIISAVGNDDYGATAIRGFALRSGDAQVDAIKEGGAAVGWREKSGEASSQILLITSERNQAFDASLDSEDGEFVRIFLWSGVWIEHGERSFEDEGNLLDHAGALIGENDERNGLTFFFAVHQALFNTIFENKKIVPVQVGSDCSSIVEDDDGDLDQLNFTDEYGLWTGGGSGLRKGTEAGNQSEERSDSWAFCHEVTRL